MIHGKHTKERGFFCGYLCNTACSVVNRSIALKFPCVSDKNIFIVTLDKTMCGECGLCQLLSVRIFCPQNLLARNLSLYREWIDS